jgi:hypothetical protein
MKNIHLIPTDKPSRLAGSEYITNEQGIDKRVFKFKLWDKLIPNKDLKDIGYIPQNIYITSDEEIKEGDWIYFPISNEVLKIGNGPFEASLETVKTNEDCKKIILTTDQDLIKDGVQTIDDEFLEWFVKNPSCKSVKIEKGKILNQGSYTTGNIVTKVYYEIIIPQEEPKFVTVEEAAEKESEVQGWGKYESTSEQYGIKQAFINGAKWQAEQDNNKFSEKVETLWVRYRKTTNNEDAWSFKEWLVEQFKNK